MSDTEYNGWKNYPTWAVNMWLSNDEGLYRQTQEMAYEAAVAPNTSQVLTDASARRYALANILKDWVTDDLAPDLGASFASDLLGYALDQVDWHEIASAWLAEVEA